MCADMTYTGGACGPDLIYGGAWLHQQPAPQSESIRNMHDASDKDRRKVIRPVYCCGRCRKEIALCDICGGSHGAGKRRSEYRKNVESCIIARQSAPFDGSSLGPGAASSGGDPAANPPREGAHIAVTAPTSTAVINKPAGKIDTASGSATADNTPTMSMHSSGHVEQTYFADAPPLLLFGDVDFFL